MKRGFLLAVLSIASCAGPGAAEKVPALRDFRGIIHCHSLYSHDSRGTYEEILAAAKAAKVDFIIMTDHPPKDDPGLPLREGWRGIRDGVLFIQGAEYGDNLLALGLKEPVTAQGRPAKIAAIHAQGGLAFVCHPEEVKDWDAFAGADGMEIYNVHAALKEKQKDPKFMLKVLKALKEDPENSYSLLQELDPAILKKWDELNRKGRFVGIAGNDSHQNVNFLGLQVDPYPRAFRFVTTHVLAKELTEQAILAALRQGRAYVRFELTSTRALRPDLLSWVGEESAAPREVEIDAALRFAEWIRSGNFKLPRVSIDGDPALDYPARYRLEDPGVYRLEARGLSLSGQAGAPWILTNNLRLR